MRRLIAALLPAALAVALIPSAASASDGSASPAVESCLEKKASEARAAVGLGTLSAYEPYRASARDRSVKQLHSGRIFHASEDVLRSYMEKAGGVRMGENLAFFASPGYSALQACGSIQEAWMASPGHRRNILEPSFNMVVIGAVEGVDDAGRTVVYVTQWFLDVPGAPASPGPASAFSDVDPASPFASDIGFIKERGVTRGCVADGSMYCPKGLVTRGQMASFLVRAFDLPSTTTDFFADDDGGIHEADINALARSGVTKGCNPPDDDRFCPDDPVTRGQMAAFLQRVLGLAPAPDPGFSDVSPTDYYYEPVAAIAEAGVTRGCGGGRFCPDDPVTREQMAAFLARALVLDRGAG